MTNRRTRRSFLGTAASAACVAPAFSVVHARNRNETLRVGLIGCGGRGSYLLDRLRDVPGAEVVGVCDVHAGRREQARQRAGGPAIRATGDFRDLLDDRSIDALIVATTDHWHVLPAVLGCQAGKDVYLEKPVGVTVAEGRAAVEAARKHDRIVQIGTQQRSWDHYREAVELIQAGRLGAISEVKVWDHENDWPGFGSPPDGSPPAELDWDFYLGPGPVRPYNPNRYKHFYWFMDHGGGWPVDWGVHHYDIVHWAMGTETPHTIAALGGKFGLEDDNREWSDTFDGVLAYGPTKVAPRGFLLQYTYRAAGRGDGRPHAKCFYGSDASLLLDRSGYQIVGEVRGNKKIVEDASHRGMTEDEAVVAHLRGFVECVQSRKRPFADVAVGHASSTPGHLLNIAYRTGRTLRWDAVAERFHDDPEACALLSRAYREPWALPT